MKLLLISIFTAVLALGQSLPTLSPANGSLTFDKATDTVKYLPEVTITASPTTNFFYTTNIAPEFASAVYVTPSVNYLFAGGTARVQISVAANTLPVGIYNIPIVFGQSSPPVILGYTLQLTVTDSRTYVLPTAAERMVPHVAAGGGWVTRMRLVNTGNTASINEFRFYTSAGSTTTFVVNGFETDYLPAVNVPARGYLDVIMQSPDSTLKTGTVRIKTLVGTVPGVNVIYASATPNFESAVELKTATASTLTIGFDNRGRNSTGIALGNALNYDQEVTLEWFDAVGLIIPVAGLDVVKIRIPANGQVIFTMDQRFPVTAGRTGTMRVTGQQPALVGFGLKFDLGAGVFYTEPAFN